MTYVTLCHPALIMKMVAVCWHVHFYYIYIYNYIYIHYVYWFVGGYPIRGEGFSLNDMNLIPVGIPGLLFVGMVLGSLETLNRWPVVPVLWSIQKKSFVGYGFLSTFVWSYCGWKKSCTTLDDWNLINNGIYIPAINWCRISFIHSITWIHDANDWTSLGGFQLVTAFPSVLGSTPVMLTGRVCLTMRHTRKMGKMMTNYGMEWGTVLYPILAILRQNYNHFKSDVAVAGLFQAKMARISFWFRWKIIFT